MCGFLGIINYKKDFDDKQIRDRITSAKKRLYHRGPDQSDHLLNSRIALIHCRLSIIDTSLLSKQPMLDYSRRYALVYNGEIYNYKDLYESYLKENQFVNPHSDSSILLYLYLKFGIKCLDLLNGIFAFAIVDLQTGDCFLARDRFGEKPLYWHLNEEGFEFSSEIKTLIKDNPNSKHEVDIGSLACFNILGIIPQPSTIMKNIFMLEPGSWMEVKAGGEKKHGVYWALNKIFRKEFDNEKINRQSVIERTKHLFEEAVRSRLVSDVPVGLFLSGGYDSNSILSVIASIGEHDVYPITLDFKEQNYSEAETAKEAAKYFGAKFYSEKLGRDQFLENLNDYFSFMDQPNIDGYNTYFVSEIAKRFGRKVWLSGTGGDELFGGYPSFKRIKYLKIISRIGSMLNAGTLISDKDNIKLGRIKQLLTKGNDAARAYQFSRNLMQQNYLNMLFPSEYFNNHNGSKNFFDALFPETSFLSDDFQVASYFETEFYLRNQLLTSVDNFSMAHSIEVRTPFLDHNLFEYVFNLPVEYKNYNRNLKPLLADSVPISLPPQTLLGEKRGFDFPLDKWMKEEFESTFRELVLDQSNSLYWNLSIVENLWLLHKKEKINWRLLWTFYVFARWLNTIK